MVRKKSQVIIQFFFLKFILRKLINESFDDILLAKISMCFQEHRQHRQQQRIYLTLLYSHKLLFSLVLSFLPHLLTTIRVCVTTTTRIRCVCVYPQKNISGSQINWYRIVCVCQYYYSFFCLTRLPKFRQFFFGILFSKTVKIFNHLSYNYHLSYIKCDKTSKSS